MNKLQFFVILCYLIPVLNPIYPLGLTFSFFSKLVGWDWISNRTNNLLAYIWMKSFFVLTLTKLKVSLDGWDPMATNRFLICNHTNALEVPLFVSLPYLSGNKDLKLSYLGGDIIQRYKIFPLMMHKVIVEAIIFSETNPDFRNFKKDVMRVLQNRSIFLYPEGERTFTEEIRPFKTGVMKMAYKFKVDVDVFVVHGLMDYASEEDLNKKIPKNGISFAYCGTVSPRNCESFEVFLDNAQKLMRDKKSKIIPSI